MRLYDAHNHLHDQRLQPFLPQLLSACQDSGVSAAVVNGTQEGDWERVLSLARAHTWIIPSFGYHPWYAARATSSWREKLLEHLDALPAAVGEIGLDRWKPGLDYTRQEELFLAQLEIAAERNLPVTIHCLQAWGRLLELLSTHTLPSCGFLLHSYSGSRELIRPLVQLGAYFSCSGSLLAPRKLSAFELFRCVPIDRLLIETDAPDQLLPEQLDTYRLHSSEGQRLNHPALLVTLYERVAQLLGLSLSELNRSIQGNFQRLFGRLIRGAA